MLNLNITFNKNLLIFGLILVLLGQAVVLYFPTPQIPKADRESNLGVKYQRLTTSAKFFVVLFFINFLFFYFLYFLLILSGDIELNPGPIYGHNYVVNYANKFENNLKIFHVNARSLSKKHQSLSMIINDFGKNCIYGISETWLKDTDNDQLFNADGANFTCFRNDRDEKTGGGVAFIFPKSLSPRTRQDLCFLGNTFQSLWVEFFLRGKSYLINISYNPCRKHANLFLEGLAQGIDKAIVEGKPIIMMGDYNLDYMVKSDRNCLETIFTPYDLIFTNKKEPTRVANKRSLLHYLIIDSSIKYTKTFIFDCPIITDHFAQLIVLDILNAGKSIPIKKTFFDKKHYNVSAFQKTLNNLNWDCLKMCEDPEDMLIRINEMMSYAIKKHAPQKTVFIRNDKPLSSLSTNFVSKETRRKAFKMQEFLKTEKFETYKSLKKGFLSNYCSDFDNYQRQLIEATESSRLRWNLINETLHCKKTKASVTALRNSFGDILTDNQKICNFLNYKFSKLGEFFTKEQKQIF